MRTSIFAFAAVPVTLLVVACGAGATSGTTTSAADGANSSSSGPATVPAGQPLTLRQSLLGSTTVATITLSNVKAGVKSSNGFSRPAKGQFITADVAVAVSEGKYTINSSSFKLVAVDGTAYDTTLALDGKDLSANDLTPGQKTTGTIVFDTAKGAETGGRIAVKDVLADGDAGYWTL